MDDQTAPEPEDSTLEGQAKITYNGWVVNALTPEVVTNSSVRGKASFTGSGTNKQGLCVLSAQLTSSGALRTCSSESNCPAPPFGGAKYCRAINNVGYKYCWERLSAALSCAGTPVTGQPIAAGTYYTPWREASPGQYWITLGCLNGCLFSDPSASSYAEIISPPGPE